MPKDTGTKGETQLNKTAGTEPQDSVTAVVGWTGANKEQTKVSACG